MSMLTVIKKLHTHRDMPPSDASISEGSSTTLKVFLLDGKSR